MKQIQRDRRAQSGLIQTLRDIETRQRRLGESLRHQIVGVVEHPGKIPMRRGTPGCETRMHAFGVRRIEELDQSRQAACRGFERQRAVQRLIQIRLLPGAQHRRSDDARAARDTRPARPHEHAQPITQELDLRRGVQTLQGIEAGGHAGLERVVGTAERAHQDLQSMVLVDQHLGHGLLGQHRHQKADQHGLAGAGRPADQRMAGIATRAAVRLARITRMQREVVRRLGMGREHRQRLAPVVALGTATRVGVKRGHRGEVARGDDRTSRAPGEGAGQLRPEGRLQRQILPRHGHAAIGQQRPREGDIVLQLCEGRLGPSGTGRRQFRLHLQRQVVLAHREGVRGQRVERVRELTRLRERKVADIAHPVRLTLQQSLRRDFGQTRERLGQDQRKRRRQQTIKQPRRRRRRILLDAEHRAPARRGRRALLEQLQTKEQPRGRQLFVQGAARQRHALRLAIHQQSQKLQQRRSGPTAMQVHPERLGIIRLECRAHRGEQFFAGLDRARALQRRLRLARTGQRTQRPALRRARGRPIHQ